MIPFRSVAFRWLWSSSLAAAGAQWMERTATAWLALEAGGGAFGVGLTFAARMLPSLLFGLIAGTLADRLDRRHQLLATNAAGLVVMLLLAGLAQLGALVPWTIVLIALLVGCFQVFDTPARQALILDTVPEETAASATALNAVAARLFGAVGALAGGVAIPLLGLAQSYLIVALLYAISLGLLAGLRHQHQSSHHQSPPPFGRALGDAVRLIVELPMVRTLFLIGIAGEVFAFSHASALPVLARDVLAAGPEGLGLLTAASSIGGTLAVIALSLSAGRQRREPLLAGIYLLYGLAIIGFGRLQYLPLGVAMMFVIGACAASFDALEQVSIQLAVPAERRGRAIGIWLLGLGSGPLGHLEVGALTALLGAPATLLLNGLLVVTGALTLLARAPAFRWWVRR